MFNRRMFALMVCCFALSASSAFAGGGGGSKKDATIGVRNDRAEVVIVFVGATAVEKAMALTPPYTAAKVTNAGGVFVNPGKTAVTKVQAGTHPVVAVVADTNNILAQAQTNVTIGKGQTKNYAFVAPAALVAY